MEIIGHRARPQHRDGTRQARGRTQHPCARIARRMRVEMHDLAARVHAGVGAARAGDFDQVIGHERQCGFDFRLHAWPMRQPLPTEEIGAVVFDTERNAHGANRP